MNKSASDPRRLYSVRGSLACTYRGSLYGSETSTMNRTTPVVVTAFNEAENTVTVRQRAPHAKGITEVWSALA